MQIGFREYCAESNTSENDMQVLQYIMMHEMGSSQSRTAYFYAYGEASRTCEAYGVNIRSIPMIHHRVQRKLETGLLTIKNKTKSK